MCSYKCAESSSEVVEICVEVVKIRKNSYKTDAYIDLSDKVTKKNLEEALVSLQTMFGKNFNMRLWEINRDDILRLQIWWESYPRKSDVEFLAGNYYDSSLNLDPDGFTKYWMTNVENM
jgi:hypothetical protein